MLSRFSLYFDEVARRGSIRRASEHLHIAPSAIDRQLLRAEERFGVPLFERLPQGMRLTSAGEAVLAVVRRWRTEQHALEAQIAATRGQPSHAEIRLALAEGSGEYVVRALTEFRSDNPYVSFNIAVREPDQVIEDVLAGRAEVGISFNTPARDDLLTRRLSAYRVGAVVRTDHRFACKVSITLSECAREPLIGPGRSHPLRDLIDRAWTTGLGTHPKFVAEANSVALIRTLVQEGMGIGLLTPFDIAIQIEQATLAFIPFSGVKVPYSAMSIVSSARRPIAEPVGRLLRHFGGTREGDAAQLG